MEWDKSATSLLEKIPSFIQGKVRDKIERFAREQGKTLITGAEVNAAKDAFIGQQDQAFVKNRRNSGNNKLGILKKYKKYFDDEGNPVLYQIKTCRGAEVNCPYLINDAEEIARILRNRLKELNFTEKLINKINGQILPHHTMKLAVSGCPNCCSMPQIKDFGVHAVEPVSVVPENECVECMKCVEVCREDAITVKDGDVTIDQEKCVNCGICARVCPVGTIKAHEKKYRVMIGGKVGRHPKFALELLPQADESKTLKALDVCVDIIVSSKSEHRFRMLIEQLGIEKIKGKI